MHGTNVVKVLGLLALAIVGVMAMSASGAQASTYLLLLNGAMAPNNELKLELEGLLGILKAENGLTIHCEKGTGTATVKGGTKITSTVSLTLYCAWVGIETCTIENPIVIDGSGEAFMETETSEDLVSTVEGNPLATIRTEGVFCTLPEEQTISGRAHIKILKMFTESTVKLGHILNLNLKLDNDSVTELSEEVHIRDFNNLAAEIGVRLES